MTNYLPLNRGHFDEQGTCILNLHIHKASAQFPVSYGDLSRDEVEDGDSLGRGCVFEERYWDLYCNASGLAIYCPITRNKAKHHAQSGAKIMKIICVSIIPYPTINSSASSFSLEDPPPLSITTP